MNDLTLSALRGVLLRLNDAALCMRSDGTIVEANAGAAAMISTERASMAGTDYREHFSLTCLAIDRAGEDVLSGLLSAGGHSPVGSMLKLRSGRIVLVDCSVSLFELAGADGGRCALVVVKPLAAFQQRAQAAIQASEGKWLALVENTQAPIYVKDVGGPFRYVNRAFCERFGLRPDEIVGMTEFETLPPQTAELFRLREREVVYANGTITTEDEIVLDGKRYFYIASRFPLTQAPDRPAALCCISTDVTSMRSMENAARLHQEELAKLSRLSIAGEMASGLAHELNQPLSAALSLVQAAGNLLGEDEADARAKGMELLVEAEEQIVRTGQIISNLRTFMQRGGARHLTPVDLNLVARKSAALLHREFNEAGARVQFSLAPAAVLISGNQLQIEQVVVNLLRNALDALRQVTDRDRLVEVETGMVTREGGVGMGRLAVRDNGCGLNPEYAGRLFDPFFSTREQGMGLGLAISRTIVERLGGSIETEPQPETGFGIFFMLPLAV